MARKLSFAIAAVALLAIPSSASASTTCSLAGGVLTVDVDGTGDQVASLRMENGGTEIGVWDTLQFTAGQQNCGTTPTQANTNSIVVTDIEAGSAQRTLLKISLAGGPFVNSDATGEGAGTQEIEITFNGGDEPQDDILFDGAPSPANDNWRMGELPGGHGFQLDDAEAGTVDLDDVLASSVEQLQLGIHGTNPGNDTYDARGGAGFTGPLTFATTVKQLVGGDGNDQIFAGDGNGWTLEGDLGADTLTGGPGNDQLRLQAGTDADTAAGNAGTDSCSYQNHNFGVHVDLRVTTPQDTVGAGIDTLTGCESLTGGAEDDILIGTTGPNSLFGGESSIAQTGDDTLIGLGANDTLDGSNGSDTVSYAQGSTGPVTVNLGTVGAQDTGGAGSDTITTVENIIGSEFSDNLTGDGAANTIDVYDGLFDTANCGGGADNAIADEAGVDALTSCEVTDNAPKVTVGAPPANGAVINDTTPAYPLTADEGATFQISVDGGGFAPCAASCEPAAPLAEGPHTLTFRAVDTDENLHPGLNPVQRTVAIDTVGPTIQIDDRPADLTNSANPSWQFSSAENGISFECQVDGAGFAPCNATVAHSAGSLPDGPHTFEVRGRDGAGNAGSALTDEFTIDRTGPEIQISQAPGELTNDDTPTWQFSSAENGVTYECIVDGAAEAAPCSGPGATHTAGPLADGNHSLVVFGRDALGNQSATVFDGFAIDTRAPEAEAPGKVKTRKKRVNVPLDADEQRVTLECSFDGAAFKPCTSPFRTPKMKRPSKHTLLVRATDQAGNTDATPARTRIKRKR